MTPGTGEGVYILFIILTLIAVHLGVNPDRFAEIRGQEIRWLLLRRVCAMLFHVSLPCLYDLPGDGRYRFESRS